MGNYGKGIHGMSAAPELHTGGGGGGGEGGFRV